MYDHTTIRPYKVLLLTCVVNCTVGTPTPWPCSVVQWSVHWALSWMTQVLVLVKARHCALETCRKKKVRAPLLGLAKSIYYNWYLYCTFCSKQTVDMFVYILYIYIYIYRYILTSLTVLKWVANHNSSDH